MKKVCIIGAGASGCACAYFLTQSGIEVTLYDKKEPLLTLLPTGGGRCNLANAEYDFKRLAANYPRGEKFLYSVFSKFSTSDTVDFFERLGIDTYIQDDNRIFPKSNSSRDVREKFLKKLKTCKFVKKEIADIRDLSESYSDIVISTGGHSGYKMLTNLGINIIESRPSLVGLTTKENLKELSGTTVKNVEINGLSGDILFTHFGVSGPLIYKVSSILAFEQMPYKLNIDFCPYDIDLQNVLNKNPHKDIKNIIAKFVPQKLAEYILKHCDARIDRKACDIDGKMRNLILEKLHNFKIEIKGTDKGEEVVTAGGVDLDEVISKTMQLKKCPHIYCIGEVLNIDGFCGGFNLQNAWSTAYIAAEAIINNRESSD